MAGQRPEDIAWRGMKSMLAGAEYLGGCSKRFSEFERLLDHPPPPPARGVEDDIEEACTEMRRL
jgi:hypothetical protein